MGRILAALARLVSAIRTVWEWCAEKGAMAARQVLTLGGTGGAAPAPVIDGPSALPMTEFRLPDVARAKKIRRLAAAMDTPDVDAGLFLGVSDPVVQWLGAMTKDMRELVAAAGAIELEDHMRGRRAIRGLLAYDRASVAEWNAASGGSTGSGGRGRKPLLRAAAAAGFGKMAG